jgi:hypothetical protein
VRWPTTEAQPPCRCFGVFEPRAAYRQGEVEVDEKLLAFIQLTRMGDQAFYTRILGHGDYLRQGIMFALHLHVMRWLLERRDELARGVELLMYGDWHGPTNGMRHWKWRAGFRPGCVYRADEVPPFRLANAGRTFPQYVLDGATSAAAFFCAAFGGGNDALHYLQRGLCDVHLVDQDFERLAAMQRHYPAGWCFQLADAFVAAREYVRERKFDVVSCDPWSPQFEQVADRHFLTFYELARRYLLITVVPNWAHTKQRGRDWFESQGMDYAFYEQIRDAFGVAQGIAERLGEILSCRHQMPVRVVDVVRRTDYAGGCYWLVIKK